MNGGRRLTSGLARRAGEDPAFDSPPRIVAGIEAGEARDVVVAPTADLDPAP